MFANSLKLDILLTTSNLMQPSSTNQLDDYQTITIKLDVLIPAKELYRSQRQAAAVMYLISLLLPAQRRPLMF